MQNFVPMIPAEDEMTNTLQVVDMGNRQDTVNEPTRERRSSITSLGDLNIIPDNYSDDLLEDAVKYHETRSSRIDYIEDRLKEYLPADIALSLASTLADSLQKDDSIAWQLSNTDDMAQTGANNLVNNA